MMYPRESAISRLRHHPENHLVERIGWLRAAVLGANDGIISTASLIVGVAAAAAKQNDVLIAGIAGLVAGAVSMALGEFVSVSSQRDSERALIARERVRLAQDPEAELAQLAGIYRAKGVSAATAHAVATELTAHDPIAAHLDAQLRLDPDDLTNPRHAAISSGASFTVGAILPILAISLSPVAVRIPVTFVAVILALAMAGGVSAALGGSGHVRAVTRLVLGGAAAMVVTYGVGSLIGAVGLGG